MVCMRTACPPQVTWLFRGMLWSWLPVLLYGSHSQHNGYMSQGLSYTCKWVSAMPSVNKERLSSSTKPGLAHQPASQEGRHGPIYWHHLIIFIWKLHVPFALCCAALMFKKF